MREWTPGCEVIARQATAGYYLPGADAGDLMQEARFGVWKALKDWRPDAGAFEAFAYVCARRQVITAVKTATRNKHRPLNESLSFDAQLSSDGDNSFTVGDLLFRWNDDPCIIVIAREAALDLLRRMRTLSAWERECLERCAIGGEEYEAVGPQKSVDNAIQRARKKLSGEALEERIPASRSIHVYVGRRVHRTEGAAVAEARRVAGAGSVVRVAKRKLIDGKERASQGRPTKDGRRGQPVWRVDLETPIAGGPHDDARCPEREL